MKTGFIDKNGNEIETGNIIKFTANERVGERTSGSGKKRNVFAIYGDVEIIGAIEFGIYNSWLHKKIRTFYITTDQTISYFTHFWQTHPRDPLKETKRELTRPLSEEIALTCEIISR
jgi:hypothetical protein